jgi:signal transduction histidine kinase
MRRPRWLRSIEGRLPLLIVALLATEAVLFVYWAHREVRRVALDSAGSRLEAASEQLAELFGTQLRRLRTDMPTRAAHPAIRIAAADTSSDALSTAQLELERILGATPATRSVAILSPDGSPRLVSGPASPGFTGFTPGMDSAVIGPLQAIGDTIYYDAYAPIRTGERTLGYLAERRVSASSATTVRLIADLIGEDVRFIIGNESGDVWTDFTRNVAGPSRDLISRFETVPFQYQGHSVHGAARRIAGAPWVIWVEFPDSVIFARSQSFLDRAAIAGALVLLAGAILGWIASRRITGPLRQVAQGAELIAGGNYEHRVPVQRSDELGRLAESFNAMADQVAASQHGLEDKVAERTGQLTDTLKQLEVAQTALVRREKLAILGQLASGVGHELRNPLGVMTNAVYYLEAIQTGPPKVREYLEILRNQIRLSEKIVGDLLDFARVRTPALESVVLSELVEAQLGRAAVPGNVRVVREFPADLPTAQVDPIQLGQVVLNLLTNAIQAMEESGGVLTLQGSRSGGSVTLHVVDTGPGMPPDVLAQVFEPLFTTKARGIGLGLAVSRSLAEANAGSIIAASVPGRGATFTLTLPATASREPR